MNDLAHLTCLVANATEVCLQARQGVNYNEQRLATSKWRAAAQRRAKSASTKQEAAAEQPWPPGGSMDCTRLLAQPLPDVAQDATTGTGALCPAVHPQCNAKLPTSWVPNLSPCNEGDTCAPKLNGCVPLHARRFQHDSLLRCSSCQCPC